MLFSLGTSYSQDNITYEIFQNRLKTSESKTVLILFCIKDSQPVFYFLQSLYIIPPLKSFKDPFASLIKSTSIVKCPMSTVMTKQVTVTDDKSFHERESDETQQQASQCMKPFYRDGP